MSDEMSTNGDSGAITPGGRFARMEASLDRIETKLDTKANSDLVVDIDKRVAVLESTDTVRNAVADAHAKAADDRYRFLLVVIAFLTIINVGLGIVVGLSSIFPQIPV